jgi:hypothetical protein
MRVIYHPAPAPDRIGRLVVPEPVEIGSDLPKSFAWIRRRLALRRSGHAILRFLNEPLIDFGAGDPAKRIEGGN